MAQGPHNRDPANWVLVACFRALSKPVLVTISGSATLGSVPANGIEHFGKTCRSWGIDWPAVGQTLALRGSALDEVPMAHWAVR